MATSIRAKTVLLRRKYLDGWFISRAGFNLYRGCAHNCVYCDGRSETYRVEGDFAGDVCYKENAVDILSRELDPRRRRKTFRPGFVFIGGGVSDSWQPVEEKLQLTRRVLELFRVFPYPLLLLSKSDLILRDLSLLKELNREQRVIIAVSISTVDDELAGILEPGASPPSARLEVVRRAREAGIAAGVMLLPLVPMISDSPAAIDASFKAAKEAGAEFINPGGMTLKPGRQKEYFLKTLASVSPDALRAYDTVYRSVPDKWGSPGKEYYDYLAPLLHDTALRYGLPRRIPSWYFPENISPAERAGVMLDQMGDLMRERGYTSSFSRASRSLHQLDSPLESPDGWTNLRKLGGVGPATERCIKEILDTGTSKLYERLLIGGNPSG